MKRLARLVMTGLLLASPARAQQDDPLSSSRTEWWREARFGMFIHWGIYSVPAGFYKGRAVPGIGEWIMNNARIPIPEYEKFAGRFNPTKFDAKEFVRVAKSAGMKYMVITSKHHDGFSMFDTQQNEYNIVKATPFKRDPMKELAEACKAEGIRFCFYYSIMDWHHPDANAKSAKKYVEQMKNQLRELVTQYDPALFWFDGQWVDWWTAEDGRELEKFLRGLKPTIIVNNRIGKATSRDGDYDTPEQFIPRSAPKGRLWETCMTLNDTWGYRRDDQRWKSPKDVVRKLIDIAGKGGNFLLNVGPTDEGLIPEGSVKVLEEVGRWLGPRGEALYGTTGFTAAPWGAITRKGRRLFVLVVDPPKSGSSLRVPVVGSIEKAKRIGDSGEVSYESRGEEGLDLRFSAPTQDSPATVIALDCEGEPRRVKSRAERTAEGEPIAAAEDGSIRLLATDAKLHGETIQIEDKHESGNVGYWTDPKDYVEWFIEPPSAGSYQVELTYACDRGCGGDFVVGIGDRKLEEKIEPTGGWSNFKTVSLGKVEVPKGKSSVSVKPIALKNALMNLSSLKLTPTR